jgi:hypothetical protein
MLPIRQKHPIRWPCSEECYHCGPWTSKTSKPLSTLAGLPVHSEAGRAVWALAQERKGEEYLFTPGLMLEIRTAIKTVDATLSLLSLQRGGLQAMAKAGLSKATLLHHSRHSSDFDHFHPVATPHRLTPQHRALRCTERQRKLLPSISTQIVKQSCSCDFDYCYCC